MKVITFSRFFPKGHPKAGEPTFFVEKILRNFWREPKWYSEEVQQCVSDYTDKCGLLINVNHFEPKVHTIRAGNRWKAGDVFSPRVWSGKPYASKQIIFAPPIQIKKIWDVKIVMETGWGIRVIENNKFPNWGECLPSEKVAKNDGLCVEDFKNWFEINKKKYFQIFSGQIICWDDKIEY